MFTWLTLLYLAISSRSSKNCIKIQEIKTQEFLTHISHLSQEVRTVLKILSNEEAQVNRLALNIIITFIVIRLIVM